MIFRLTEDLVFPDPSLAEPDGLLAIGGDLSIERLQLAYANGIFPWFSEDDPILWFAPHKRCVLFPGNIHISRSMHRTIKSGHFSATQNKDFAKVIRHCAEINRNDGNGTWITPDMQAAYITLHHAGTAESIEVWKDGALVGGMYGVVVNNVFCGESMFSLEKDASKMAMVWLCNTGRFRLIDCQIPNDHLLRMGAEMIDAKLFRQWLKD